MCQIKLTTTTTEIDSSSGGGGYPSTENQSVYSTVPADWAWTSTCWLCYWPNYYGAGTTASWFGEPTKQTIL